VAPGKLSRRLLILSGLASAAAAITYLTSIKLAKYEQEPKTSRSEVRRLKLPPPSHKSSVSVEEALTLRRSIREYEAKPLTLKQVSQILWAAQGITLPEYGFRTAPSAGATYPLEVYLVVKRKGVRDLDPGVYHYLPHSHELELIRTGDYSKELMKAALDQEWVGAAAVNLVINAVYERTTKHYGDRGVRYVYMEVGHVGENVYLQCVSLGLGCVVIGAFYDEEVKRIIGGIGEPLYVIPIGVKRGGWGVGAESL